MHRLILLFMLLTAIKAQTPERQAGDAVTKFQPSLPVVVGALAVMFILTFILLLFAKCCREQPPEQNDQSQGRLARSRSRYSGIDKTVIESLPFFRFSALKGTREGLECAVCLSKFLDIEILRLLPKCRHAFHIDCVDQWLERHSSCPLCRCKVDSEDLALITSSDSLRFLQNQSDSNLELFVQRQGSARSSRGSSFRNGIRKEEEVPIEEICANNEDTEEILHKLNHKIIVSDVALLKNRWSSVTSSDLMFLNSEMINEVCSTRFSLKEVKYETFGSTEGGLELMRGQEEMERKKLFEHKLGKNMQNDAIAFAGVSNNSGQILHQIERRSMSEIKVHPRLTGSIVRGEPSGGEENVNEERQRKLWLPIARRTVEWFVNTQRRPTQSVNTRQSQNV